MTEENKATSPQPWKLDEYEPWTVNDAKGDQVATCWGDESNKADAANAALIVRAVNGLGEVETMRKALELALDAMNYMGDVLNNMDAATPEDIDATTPAFDAVRAALSRGEG